MALETPNGIAAAAVLLAEDLDGSEQDVGFRSNAGFASVAFVDEAAPEDGFVLDMQNPVTVDEGIVFVGGSPNADGGAALGWVTPTYLETGITAYDELADNRVVAVPGLSKAAYFFMGVTVFAVHTDLEPIEGLPIAP